MAPSSSTSLSISPLVFLLQLQLLFLSSSTFAAADGPPGPSGPPPCAIGLKPSSEWTGIDGSWSTFELSVGGGTASPPQNVSVLVSTALSEIWVVETGGCLQSALCTKERGGLVSVDAAEANGVSSWQSLGAWSTGLKEPGLVAPNADYGLATVSFSFWSSLRSSASHSFFSSPRPRPSFISSIRSRSSTSILYSMRSPLPQLQVNRTLVAGFNDTTYYVGYIGIGALDGNFNGRQINPLIRQLAEAMGTIPSHSYGYTAGASYRGNGTPASLTLGGYDLNRVVLNHSSDGNNKPITFSINGTTRQPELLLRGIAASAPPANDSSAASAAWAKNVPGNSSTVLLTNITDPASSLAVIDSTTPFLWMPQDICDRFATTLGLVWNNTLGLHLFSSPQLYSDYRAGQGASLTFSLASTANAGADGSVSLTLSSAAFALTALYPYAPSMKYNDPPIPYFPLKCLPAADDTTTSKRIVIGRAFMQEVYMIMNYDAGYFGLHQAKFPDSNSSSSGGGNVHLVDIPRSPSSPFPLYKGGPGSGNDPESSSGGLSPAATAGVVVAAFVAGTLAALALWFYRRRHNQVKQKRIAAAAAAAASGDDGDNGRASSGGKAESAKDGAESTTETEPSTPLSATHGGSHMERIFSFIGRGRWSSRRSREGLAGDKAAGSLPTSPTSVLHADGDVEKNAFEVAGSFAQPVEVGADAQHARYELPVPLPPVELDATAGGVTATGRNGSANRKIDDALIGGGVVDDLDDGHGYCDYEDATAVLGSDGVQHLTAYEVARRRMQRQLRGPVPTYEPPTDPAIMREVANNSQRNTEEGKTDQDVSPVAHYRAPPLSLTSRAVGAAAPALSVSAVSSQTATNNTAATSPTAMSATTGSSNHSGGSLAMLPSPMTPSSAGWPGRGGSGSGSPSASGNGTFDLPSPMTMAAPFPSMFFQGDGSSDNENHSSGDSSDASPTPAQPLRTTIDPTRVVCLGPLPEDVLAPVPSSSSVLSPTATAPPPPRWNHSSSSESGSSPSSMEAESTLGTNYTLEEEARLVALKNQIEDEKAAAVAAAETEAEVEAEVEADTNTSPPAERIDASFELVHVPQLAARRYSWEGHEDEGGGHEL